MEKLRVGVVGVGHLGEHHARIYHELENIELCGVVDINEDRAKEIALIYKCAYFKNYFDLYNKVDAVSIVVPTTLHYQVAEDFLRKGKDVLIEKPITSDLSQADKLVDIQESKKLIIQIGHLERFNAAVVALNSLIDSPRFIESNRIGHFVGRATDVDVILDLMIHDIDIILSIVKSPVKDIKAIGIPIISSHIDIANCRLEFENGCTANVTSSRVSLKKERKIRIFQKDSYLSLDYAKPELRRSRLIRDNRSRFIDFPFKVTNEKIKIDKVEPLKAELEAFVKTVRCREKPLVSAMEGRDALSVALKIKEKITLG
ncbi:MAG: Gfo/Idh/MocA family oxidoreductase [bacterium]